MAYSVPALTKLLAEIDELAPNRSRVSDGWIGDPAHAARHSDHNPEPDGSVDARDFTHDPAAGADMNRISEQIRKDPRVLGAGYVIWDWQITDDRGEWRPYTGTNGHTTHMHVSVNDEKQNDTSPWLEEEGLTMADITKLVEAVNRNTEVLQDVLTAIRNQHQMDRKQDRGLWRAEKDRDADQLEVLDAIEAGDT